MDRPHIVDGVFHTKMMKLLDDIVKKLSLEKLSCISTLLSSKRDKLSTCFDVFTLDNEDNPKTPDDVGKLIYAVFSDKNI